MIGDLYYSHDFGATWNLSSIFPHTNWRDLVADQMGKSWIVCGDKFILRSLDYGVTWTAIYEDLILSFSYCYCDPTGQNLVAFDMMQGITIRSSNFGRNWKRNSFFDHYHIVSLTMDTHASILITVDNIGTIKYSKDYGLSFVPLDTETNKYDNDYLSKIFVPASGNVFAPFNCRTINLLFLCLIFV